MKFERSKEWWLAKARHEGEAAIGAGLLALDPTERAISAAGTNQPVSTSIDDTTHVLLAGDVPVVPWARWLAGPAFVGRERECSAVLTALADERTSVVEIVAGPGMGKTAFLSHLMERAADSFPGGIEWFSGSRHFALSEAVDAIAESFARQTGRRLLVIDDADELSASDVLQAIERLGTGPWPFQTIIAGRQPLGIDTTRVEFGGLGSDSFSALFKKRIDAHADDQSIRRAWRAWSGSPLLLHLAHHGSRAGNGQSWADFLRYMEPFEHPGSLDAGGHPLEGSRGAREVVADLHAINEALAAPAARSAVPEAVQLEALAANLFRERGYEISLTPRSVEASVDLFAAAREDRGTLLCVLEAKSGASNKQRQIEVVHSLHGFPQPERISASVILRTSSQGRSSPSDDIEWRCRLRMDGYVALRSWLSSLPRAPREAA
jgi:hypothetical protein